MTNCDVSSEDVGIDDPMHTIFKMSAVKNDEKPKSIILYDLGFV